MKKYIITCAALFAMSYYGHAQIGIGTKTPDATTALDMSQVKNKGVLFPQVTLADVKSVAPFTTSLKKGLLVYNTNTSLLGIKGDATGFYQWNGLSWDKLVSHSEVVKLIEDSKGESNEDLKKLIEQLVNENKDGKFSGTSVVMYDFDKEEFYTLVKDKDGSVIKSTPINLTNAIRKAETNTFIRSVQGENNKTVGYLYFSEEAIKAWQKANPAIAADYVKQMKKEDGVFMDVVGDVTNNLEEIVKSKKEFFETFIKNIKGNVTVSVEGDRTYLIYNDGTKEIKIDLSQLETETFVRTIKESRDGKEVIMGYVHFNEEQINKWIKANPAGANSYKTEMKNSDGTYLDIIGAVTNNLKEIFNNNGDLITQIINNAKGNVTVKVIDGKTYLVYKDENGKEVIIDLSAMEVDTFIRAIIDPKTDKLVNYVYFSEAAITKWQSANKDIASRYKDMMKETDGGTIIDIVGTVSQNFEKIINNEGNKELITKIITNSEGNVTVKVVDGKTVLVYKDKEGQEHIIDLSALEVDTFVKAIIDPKTDKILNYVYFGEAAITAWQKANPKKADDYKDLMKPADGGVIIDVVGAVTQNFEKIIKEGDNIKLITEVVEKTKGAVSVEERNGKLVLVYVDETGKKQEFDLSAIETETYIIDIVDPTTKKITGYVYFSEEAIAKWRKANPGKDYKKDMTAADGKSIDVVGAVTNNFKEIINEGDNIKHITEVIEKTKGAVSVEERNGKLVLVYVDETGKKQEFDLSAVETETYIIDIVDPTTKKITGYVYFSEEAIAKWRKANPGKDYKKDMTAADGKSIDVVGTVNNNFKEIINEGDNIKHITEVIEKTKGVVSVEERDGKLILVYVDENGKKQEYNLSAVETNTFVRIVPGKDSKGNPINLKYVYFGEEAIATWKKANPGKDYKELMPETAGVVIDVLTDVTNNLGDIINNSGDAFNDYLNAFLIKGGNVYYGKLDPKDTTAKDVLYSVIKDPSTGKETRTVIDLTNTIKEILKETNNDLIKELKSAVAYDITKEVAVTNIKSDGKEVSVFSAVADVNANDAEVKGVNLPDSLWQKTFKVFDVKLYDASGNLLTVNVSEFAIGKTDFNFALGSGEIYSTLPAGKYKVVVYFTN
ncbi:hypothetical protein [Myroides marinus]|uniref:hypothetical protein n=1 Tax=Myroides marinus TaxID=703342 RepID=UPI0025774A47|nr:hypothetical protein [Myroides marinus]MDM1378017.1 hypothetical protein [Myroides marinus]MDM1385288.1 hypothetical protein [Myroides marinus]MDM1392501.1 hypothetical protein [Myroides marinus]